jgi:pyridoxal biosynthesis lyase PdxS
MPQSTLGTGDVVQAVKHNRTIATQIAQLSGMDERHLIHAVGDASLILPSVFITDMGVCGWSRTLAQSSVAPLSA